MPYMLNIGFVEKVERQEGRQPQEKTPFYFTFSERKQQPILSTILSTPYLGISAAASILGDSAASGGS